MNPDEATDPSEHLDGPVETRYLDLDGDGVPDAVQTVKVVGVDLTGDGASDVVEIVEGVEADIGVDGVPQHVVVVEDAVVDLHATDES